MRRVYSSVVTEYKVRDQVRFVKQYAGAASGTSGLQSETQYDGHGRVWRTHTPAMDADIWNIALYHTNDTVQSVTDARNATATYTYNARGLVTGITYNAPAGITAMPNVGYLYDAAGCLASLNETYTGGGATLTTMLIAACDGDGLGLHDTTTGGTTTVNAYVVRSSALGGAAITKLKATGEKD